ncbi:MAG TPA: DUF397 domain-containing protein [Streptosporangiaceae bacterium]
MERVDPSSPAGLSWRTSRYCNGGDCIRVASNESVVFVGDSKDPEGPVLSYSKHEWHQFVTSIKRGDYDRNLID